MPCNKDKCCSNRVDKDDLVPGLKKAIQIVDNRLATAKALGGVKEWLAAFEQVQVFLKAELWRQENPEEAEKSRTILGG